MKDILLWLGRLAGIGGALVCLLSVIARLGGAYILGGFQVGTLLQVGIALLVFGCFGLLAALTWKSAGG